MLSDAAKRGIKAICELHRLSPSRTAEEIEKAERAAGSPVFLAELERAAGGVTAVIVAGLRDEADGLRDPWGLSTSDEDAAQARSDALAAAGAAEARGDKGAAELIRGGIADAEAEEAAARAAAATLERQAASAGAGEE